MSLLTDSKQFLQHFLNYLKDVFIKHPEPLSPSFIFHDFKRKHKLSLSKEDDKKLRDKVRYYLFKLVELDILEIVEISPRLKLFKLIDPIQLLDLIKATARPKPTRKAAYHRILAEEAIRRDSITKYGLLMRNCSSNPLRYEAEKYLLTKPPATYTAYDKEILERNFLYYIDDVQRKVILMRNPENEIVFFEYRTRFTDKRTALELLSKFDKIIENAKKEFDKAVFLTITVPDIFPLRVQQYIISYLIHRIKSFLRKRLKFNPPHIRVNEPQKKLSYHCHCLIFGTDFIMPKQQLTKYLEKHLIEFLSNMGNHYKKTINKRADDVTVDVLNEYGKILLKIYRKYKKYLKKRAKKQKKQTEYEGIINWVTKVKMNKEAMEFSNLPPDLKDYLENRTFDGANVTVDDYIKKYLKKNVTLCSFLASQPQRAADIETASKMPKSLLKVAWYWLLKIPFYTCSNKLRPPKEKKPKMGYEFITACTIDEAYELLNKMYPIP